MHLKRWLTLALAYGPLLAVLAGVGSLLSLDGAPLHALRPRWMLLALSLALLCLVFALRSAVWWFLLRRAGIPIRQTLAFVSANRSLPLKYLPGKVWVVLGRAARVHHETGLPLLPLSTYSAVLQLLSVLTGLLLGFLGLALLWWPPGFLVGLVILLSLAWVTSRSRHWPEWWIGLLPGQHLKAWCRSHAVPALSAEGAILIGQWLVLGAAFWVFFAGCSVPTSSLVVLLQPAANSIGIAAAFAPAGMGVREGVTTAYLVQLEVPWALALALVVAARIWFLTAELIMFFLSFLPFDRWCMPIAGKLDRQ